MLSVTTNQHWQSTEGSFQATDKCVCSITDRNHFVEVGGIEASRNDVCLAVFGSDNACAFIHCLEQDTGATVTAKCYIVYSNKKRQTRWKQQHIDRHSARFKWQHAATSHQHATSSSPSHLCRYNHSKKNPEAGKQRYKIWVPRRGCPHMLTQTEGGETQLECSTTCARA